MKVNRRILLYTKQILSWHASCFFYFLKIKGAVAYDETD